MVHANHCTGAQLEQNDQPSGGASSKGGRSGSGGSSKRSGMSQGSNLSSGSTSGMSFSGGAAAGWIISIPRGGPTIYHSGDTNVFSDMGLIDSLYGPTHVLLPIGGKCTMGPYEAAIACKKFLTTCHTVIPMHFSSGET